jgi:hypothetical protein
VPSKKKPTPKAILFQKAFPDPFSKKLTLPPYGAKWQIPRLCLSILYDDVSVFVFDLQWVINSVEAGCM